MAKVKIRASQSAVEQAAKSGDFEEPQPGLYVAKLEEAKPGFSKGEDGKEDKSRPYLECIYKITGEGREGRPTDKNYSRKWDYVTFGESTEWKVAQFGLAMGLPLKGGAIDGEVETDPDKAGTIIGKEVLLRIKRDTDLDGNYRGKIAFVGTRDADAETAAAFADEDEAEADTTNPFDDDTSGPDTEDELLTREYLESIEDFKALGELAKEFDLDPSALIVRNRAKQVDLVKTKAAVVDAILEAQGADNEEASEEASDDPF